MVELLKRSDTMAAKNSGEAEKTLFGMSIKSSKNIRHMNTRTMTPSVMNPMGSMWYCAAWFY